MTTKTMTDWERAEFALTHSDRVLLYGLPGTGKTYFGLNYALRDKTAYRLICTEEMTDADLIGCYKQNSQGTWSFAEGVGIRAWREGARLVVDEINRMNGDVESRMMALIDSTASSSWQHPDTGEVVKPHETFSVVATMNGEPSDLAPAILDRLIVRAEVNTPHPDAINALPEYLRGLARKLTKPTLGSGRKSVRAFYDFHKMFQSAPEQLEACAMTVFPNEYQAILEVLRTDTKVATNAKMED